MTISTSDYAVGRGRPPVRTRFQKGQSGNPSGKPGPAKLAKQRFQRALWAVLEGSPEDLEHAKPESVIAAIARKMALDASDGRIAAARLVLSLLDAESERSSGMEDDAAEQLFTGADLLSLLQGKMQGNEKQWLEEILWPCAGEKSAETPPRDQLTTSPQGGGTASPFSLVQGKTQGNGKISTGKICPAPQPRAASRALLMTGTAPVSSRGRSQHLTLTSPHSSFVTAGLVPAAQEHGPS